MSIARGLERALTPKRRSANPGWPVHYSDATMVSREVASQDQDFLAYLQSVRAFPTIAACINKLVALATAVPLYEEDRKTGERLPRDEWRLVNQRGDRLLERPNIGEGQTYFLAKSYQQLGLCGNLVQFAAATPQAPEELYVAEFDRIKWILSEDNQYPIAGAVYNGARRKQRIDFAEMILSRRPHEKDLVFGSSFIRECQDALEVLFLARQYNKSLLRRGGRIGGIFLVKSGLSPAQRTRIESKMAEREGAKNAGRSLLVDADEGTYLPDGSSPQDLEHATTMAEARLEVLNVFGFMPALFATKDVNRSNLREAKASAYEDCVRPFMQLMLEQWNAHPMTIFAGVYVRADWDGVDALQPNRLEEAQAEVLLLDRRVITPNESRARLKVGGPVEWGDQPILPPPAISLGFLPPGLERNPEATPIPAPAAAAPPRGEAPASGSGRSDEDRDRIVRQLMEHALGREAVREGVAIAARDAAAAAAPHLPPTPARGAKRPPLSEDRVAAVQARARAAGGAPGGDCGCGAGHLAINREQLEALGRGTTRDRLWVRLHQSVTRRQGVWIGHLQTYFRALEDEVLAMLDDRARRIGARAEDGPAVPSGWAIADWFDDAQAVRTLRDLMAVLGPGDVAAGAEYQQAVFERILGAGIEMPQYNGLVDLGLDSIAKFIARHTAEHVTKITETDRNLLRQVVEASVDGNETVNQLALRIQEHFEFERATRATTIARTETIGLFTFGGIQAMQQAGVEEHEWNSARIDTTRAAHLNAHGQVVRVGQNFRNEDPETGRVATGLGPGLMDAAWANVNCICGTLPAMIFPEDTTA